LLVVVWKTIIGGCHQRHQRRGLGGGGWGGGVADVLLGTRMVAWALDSVDRFYMALWVRWGGHAALLGVLGGMPKGKFQCCDKDFCN
jgi:hypothetical protein